MRCPFCDANRDRVVDSRESRDGAVIRRRRECLECNRRFTSYEQIEEVSYMVVKHDGRREEFSRKKLLEGLVTASRSVACWPRTSSGVMMRSRGHTESNSASTSS